MTDRPPETALDRLRAGLHRRNDPPSPAPAPETPPAPSKPAAAAPPVDPAPANQPAARSGQAPPPRRQAVSADRADLLQDIARRRERSRTRIRINLTWAVAVTLVTAVLATAAYVSPPRMQDELFSRLWPWRAHVWNRYGGYAIWCVNEARKRKEAVVCQVPVERDGPDCPPPETAPVNAAYLCPPWKTSWPTDPAPRWSAGGPPQWSR